MATSGVQRPGNMSDVISNKLGLTARCPKCGNTTDFTAYMMTDIISMNLYADHRVGRPWIIGEPNLGMLMLKDVRCSKCGHRGSARRFSTNGSEEKDEEV